MEFEWDEHKERANIFKHGLDFATAAMVFADPHVVLREDRTDDSGEQQPIRLRCAEPPTTNRGKHQVFVEDADALYAEFAAQGVEFTRGLANMPWRSREFVVKDCDGRLPAFGANL